MTKKQEEKLLAELVVLRTEVERLREQVSKIQVVHNHYHYDTPQSVPLSTPSYHYIPWTTWGDVTASDSAIRLNTNE